MTAYISSNRKSHPGSQTTNCKTNGHTLSWSKKVGASNWSAGPSGSGPGLVVNWDLAMVISHYLKCLLCWYPRNTNERNIFNRNDEPFPELLVDSVITYFGCMVGLHDFSAPYWVAKAECTVPMVCPSLEPHPSFVTELRVHVLNSKFRPKVGIWLGPNRSVQTQVR